MKDLGLNRYALVVGLGSALLAGCGGAQPPIGAPGMPPQVPALAAQADNTNYKIVYSFGPAPDGSDPEASLIDVGGTLYGTTAYGGAGGSCSGAPSNGGTVFSITLSGTEKVLHTFVGNETDGCGPRAALIDVGGKLYGTTSGGGMYGCGNYSGSNYDPCGTVFSITIGGKEKVLHYFGSYGSGDGDDPNAALIEVNGTLHGTTSIGGSHYCPVYPGLCGTVFTITLAGVEKVLYDFRKGTDGNFPFAGLINVGQRLYGTAQRGGDYNCGNYEGCGTVFSLTTRGRERTLHTFGSGSDGRFPNAALIDVSGTFYGTTTGGGSHSCDPNLGCGTVFSITAAGKEKVLHSFGRGSDGSAPDASLLNVNGTLYGTTSGGGAYGGGTVFALKP
jgi:uncharacterized repeat protein (TIGR03803 family)